MTASLFQKSRSHSDEYESLPQHRDDVSNGQSQPQNQTYSHGKRSRLSVARAFVLICIGSMLLALVHIHYTNLYRQERESTASNTKSSTITTPGSSNLNEPPNEKVDTPPVDTKPETTTPTTTTATSATTTTTATTAATTTAATTNTNKNNGTPATNDDALTTTVRFDNGTYFKTFKPEFFNDATKARKGLGSFLETLENRAWWNSDATEEALQPGTPITNTFFSYLPMGGGNNQFTSLQKAALLAKDLGRTLIIPPIAPSSHIKLWSGPRYSEFYDLQSFSAQSKIPILEWHDVKHTPENPPAFVTHHWEDYAEDFPCIPNGGIGANDKLYDHFRPQFLMNYSIPAGVNDRTHGKSTDYVFARDVLLKDSKNNGEQDMWKCLTCPYFLNGGDLNDRAWHEIGLHMRFNDKIEKMVDDILDLLLKPKNKGQLTAAGRRHPEFIIIHLRRGDIVTKCKPNQPEEECIVQIEEIAEKVDAIEKQRRIQILSKAGQEGADAAYERLPVLVTTNEKRKEELEKLEKLGWIMLDHGDEEKDAAGHVIPSKTIKLGTMTALGQFYPPMLDAVLLTRGDYLIGMSNSRMSQLAAQRGAAWHQHATMLM